MGITATSWLRETRRLDLVVLDVAVGQPKVTSEVCVKDGTMALAQMQNLEKSCQHRQYSINQPKRQLSAQRSKSSHRSSTGGVKLSQGCQPRRKETSAESCRNTTHRRAIAVTADSVGNQYLVRKIRTAKRFISRLVLMQ